MMDHAGRTVLPVTEPGPGDSFSCQVDSTRRSCQCPANTVTGGGPGPPSPGDSEFRPSRLTGKAAEVGPPWHSRLRPAACPAQAGTWEAGGPACQGSNPS